MSDQIKQTLAAGQAVTVERSANFFLLAESSAAVEVVLFRQGRDFLNIAEAGAGYKFRTDEGMTSARITNRNAVAVDIEFLMTRGDTDVQVADGSDKRAALTTTAHEVTNADGQLVGENLKRVYLEIQNNHATDAIYLKTKAGAATTTNGIKVAAGDTYYFGIAPTDQVRAIGDALSNTQIIVVEG